jgi:hypothetical protein
MGVPVFVVTHTVPDGWPRDDAHFTFVTDGIESAVAKARAIAGQGLIAIASANIAQQCLNAGLLDDRGERGGPYSSVTGSDSSTTSPLPRWSWTVPA